MDRDHPNCELRISESLCLAAARLPCRCRLSWSRHRAGLNVGFPRAVGKQPAHADTTSLITGSVRRRGPAPIRLAFRRRHLNTMCGQVNSAFQKAIGQTLADQVKNGALDSKPGGRDLEAACRKTPARSPTGWQAPLATRQDARLSRAARERGRVRLGISDTPSSRPTSRRA